MCIALLHLLSFSGERCRFADSRENSSRRFSPVARTFFLPSTGLARALLYLYIVVCSILYLLQRISMCRIYPRAFSRASFLSLCSLASSLRRLDRYTLSFALRALRGILQCVYTRPRSQGLLLLLLWELLFAISF